METAAKTVLVDCRPCDACRAVTPHSRPVGGLWLLAGVGLLALALLCFFLGEAAIFPGILFASLALGFVGLDRRSLRRIECERCRGKEWAKRRSARHKWLRDLSDTAFFT